MARILGVDRRNLAIESMRRLLSTKRVFSVSVDVVKRDAVQRRHKTMQDTRSMDTSLMFA